MLQYVKSALRVYLNCTSAAVAIEYAIIAVAMFLALVPGFYYVSSAVQQKFAFIGNFLFG